MTAATTTPVAPENARPSLLAAQWFLWNEADLLDRQDYKNWLDLWTPEGLYIIPTEHAPLDSYVNVLNVLYDDAEMRRARVTRLTSGFATASNPSARTTRVISRFVPVTHTEDMIDIRAAMLLTEYKYQHTRILAADVDYRLAIEGNGLRLERKIVRLINADDYLPTIGYLL